MFFENGYAMLSCEYGYAADGVARLKQHVASTNTNYSWILSRVLLEHKEPNSNIMLDQEIVYWTGKLRMLR
jgi:lipocalin